MLSSISGSKSRAAFYARVLVAICAIVCLLFETASYSLLRHHSETYTRVSHQYAEALKVRPAGPGEPTSVLMVGNSLLLEGVDVNRLRQLTSDRLQIYPIFLEATGYYDWFYGLQRLFRQGARPQVVVLGVGVNSFLADGVRQDYAPMMFFDARDVVGVAWDLKLDRTATSNLMFAHLSAFWDTRSVIRTQILRRVIPHFQELFSMLKAQPQLPLGPEFTAIAIPRIENLHRLCEAYGARLIILVPPTLSSVDGVREFSAASQRVRVETLVPIAPAALSEKYYQSDELHLNAEGAGLFTVALAGYLPSVINSTSTDSEFHQ